jgi:F-type H+-transporting ATPase subunit b
MQYFLAGGGGLLSFETGFGVWVLFSTITVSVGHEQMVWCLRL